MYLISKKLPAIEDALKPLTEIMFWSQQIISNH